MSWQQIASGGVVDLAYLSQYENSIPEGTKGWLQLQLSAPITQSMVDRLKSALVQAGVEDVQVTTGSPVLNITFRKGFPWLAVIAAIILAMAIIAILVIGWKLFKEVIPEGAQFPVAIVLIAIAGLVAFGYARRRT